MATNKFVGFFFLVKKLTTNRLLRNKFHTIMKDVLIGEEFNSGGDFPVEGFVLNNPKVKLDANWSGKDLKTVMKLVTHCPVSEQMNAWGKLEHGKYSEQFRKLKVEMEKSLVGIKCFIIGEDGGLPFLILGLCRKTGALIGVASTIDV